MTLSMMETVFVQLGGVLVNISKVKAIKPGPTAAHHSLLFFDGPEGQYNPMLVECTYEQVQQALAETYQQMAMMQAAANKAYGSQGGVH